MDISATGHDQVLPSEIPVIPADRAAENRKLVQAVKAINKAELLGQQNELRFQLDQRTHKLLVRMVNRKTGEVVAQYPAEWALRLAEDAGK